MTSLEYYIEQIEQFISALTDDIESGEGTIVTQTKLAVYQEMLEHLEEIEQEQYYKDLAKSYEKTINKLTKAIAEQESCENCDKCEVGNPCIYCKHEFEPQESEEV